MAEWVRVLLVNFLWPVVVLATFLYVYRGMRVGTAAPPVIETFILFVIYGGLAQALLTELAEAPWSALASLGVGFLVFVAPALAGMVAWRLWGRRRESRHHHRAWVASLAYPFILAATIGLVTLVWRE